MFLLSCTFDIIEVKKTLPLCAAFLLLYWDFSKLNIMFKY